MKFSVSEAGMDKYLSYEEEFACIKKAGYDGVDFMLSRYNRNAPCRLENEEEVWKYAAKVKKLAEASGLSIFQTHAPFPTGTSPEDFIALRNAIIATSVMGAKYVIIHPVMPHKWILRWYRKTRFEENIKFYRSLEPIAQKFGVKIALENMFASKYLFPYKRCDTVLGSTPEIIKMVDALGMKNFGFCLDIGHFNLLRKDPVNAIYELGHRITCLHLHDNNGRSDLHKHEGTGTLDWNAVCKALKDVGYKGVYNSEANTSVLEGGKEKIADNLKKMYEVTRSLPYSETEV